MGPMPRRPTYGLAPGRLKEARLARSLTQAELAERLGVSRPLVSQWESGETTPGLGHLRELCLLLRVTADHLLGMDLGHSPQAGTPESTPDQQGDEA